MANYFAIEPKRDCPHIITYFTTTYDFNTINHNGPCKTCGDTTENWVCLTCFEVYCSREVKGHMIEHEKEVHHKIVLSFSDISVWCYECDSYITHQSLNNVLSILHQKKFQKPLPYHKVSLNEADLKETIEPAEDTRVKAKQLAQWIKESKTFVIFTGAGISTAAGIPDFRGPDGVWTLQAQGRNPTRPTTSTLQAIPTLTHMAILQLERKGIMKFLISQNVDGFHRKSGVDPNKLAELHGNTNLEICKNCGKNFIRDFHTRTASNVNYHNTGRKCTVCSGDLLDSIINFGENLPLKALSDGFTYSEEADVYLVLGSSLRVNPAAEMPVTTINKGGKLIICNLQKTPLDSKCTLRIFAKCDDLMKMVMEELQLEIPPFILRRRILVTSQGSFIYVKGIDVDGTLVTFCKQVFINNSKATLNEDIFFYGSTKCKQI